jgi:hypothetical protein
MEHVLRQCLIACRLGAHIGLDDAARTDVYYTAPLVNVGSHTDAHEQARWFGDDIAVKATKHDAPLGSLRNMTMNTCVLPPRKGVVLTLSRHIAARGSGR